MKLFRFLNGFFFQQISATGFGLMRIVWGGTVFAYMLMNAPNVVRYYSAKGIVPPELYGESFRNIYRYSLLDTIYEPGAVVAVYCVLLFVSLLATVGLWTRASTILTFVLLATFHERNLSILGGGDTVLRVLGFLLCIAPTIKALSLERLGEQWKHWQVKRRFLPPLQMSIWPYRLLLWQFVVIYVTSGWDKIQGEMWLDGTAVAAVFHHAHFVRFPLWVMDYLSIISPVASAFTLLFLFGWLLILVPRSAIPEKYRIIPLKRVLLLMGILFHGGIQLLLEVGSFSFAMLAGYCGLLLQEDLNALRQFFNTKKKKPHIVLYDGTCGLCARSVFLLQAMDWLKRIKPQQYQDKAAHEKIAPAIKLKDLDAEMHVKKPNGTFTKGFDGFRTLTWQLPPLWILAPFLYVPLVPFFGRKVYRRIAKRRMRCTGKNCQWKLGK